MHGDEQQTVHWLKQQEFPSTKFFRFFHLEKRRTPDTGQDWQSHPPIWCPSETCSPDSYEYGIIIRAPHSQELQKKKHRSRIQEYILIRVRYIRKSEKSRLLLFTRDLQELTMIEHAPSPLQRVDRVRKIIYSPPPREGRD